MIHTKDIIRRIEENLLVINDFESDEKTGDVVLFELVARNKPDRETFSKNRFIAKVVDQITRYLLKDNQITIRGLGTFYRLPGRQGKVNNGFTGEKQDPKYKWRIKFTPTRAFRDIICK